MEFKYLKTRTVNKTLWVEIHNPPVNFLTMDLLEEMFTLLKKVRKDDSVRVLVLTGGREDSYIMHFSIHELQKLTSHLRRLLLHLAVKFRPTASLLKGYMTFNNWLMDRSSIYEWIMLKIAKLLKPFSTGMFLWYQMMRLYFAVERLNKITIAAINGACNGGGTELSACFDFRFMVADQGFTIGQPESLVNIVPGGGSTQRLPRLIGRAKALELMIRGNQLSAQEAKHIGLVTDIFNKKVFHKKVQEFADLMSKRPPLAVHAIKTAVLDGMDTTLRHGMSVELEQSIRCFDSKDTEMAMKKYLQYIEKNIMTFDHVNATTRDIKNLLDTTLDVMEKAKIFDEFQGK